MPMYYMITLDSHEYIGPFNTQEQAHEYAMLNERWSYQLVQSLPQHAVALLRNPN